VITRLHGGTAQQTDVFVFMAVRTAASTRFDPVLMRDGQCSVFGHMRTMLCIRTYADNLCLVSENLRTVFSLYSDIQCHLSLHPEAMDNVSCVSGHMKVCPLYPDRCGQRLLSLRIFADVFSVSGHTYFLSGQLRTVCPSLPDLYSLSCVRAASNSNQHDESCP